MLLGREPSSLYCYKANAEMEQLSSSQMSYSNISRWAREDISKRKLINYLMGRNPICTDEIFRIIGWDDIQAHLQKQGATRVTNIIKLVHGWQHDGY